MNNTKKNTKGVKPLVMVSEIKNIKEEFGKYSIIIKDNAVYRCSTDTLERGPKALYDLYLPNYGKMRKFVVKEDGVYEIIDKVNIDPSNINFDLKTAWNNKKVTE